MKKISILGTIIFAGTLLISPDAAEAKSKQKLRASEDIGEKSEKHSNKKRSKRKISSNVRITHAKKDESKIYSRKAEKKKNKKENDQWKYEIASLDEDAVGAKLKNFVDPIIDKSQLRQNPIKIESKSFTTKNAKSFGSGAMQALAIDTSGSPNSKTAKKIAFASDFNRRPHLIVNKNSSNKTKEKSSDENDITKLDLEKSMIIANDLRQQLKHSYKINSKESAKFRQELEKYRNIFVGAYEN